MKATIKFFLVLVTITVILFAWLTHQLSRPELQILILALIVLSSATFLLLNILEQRENHTRRKLQESKSKEKPGNGQPNIKRSDTSFALKERKAGLTWGGGNIKASEAKRGTRRKFLGR